MKTLKTAVLAIVGLCGAAMSGCQTPKAPQMATQIGANEVEGYRLGAGDEIKVTVFDDPTLSGAKVVDGQGAITMELIGAVTVKNLTLVDAQKAIEKMYKDGRYLRDPHITVEMTKGRPYYILGEVIKVGEYPFTSGLTVMNAITAAGGFTYRANEQKIMITSADSLVEKEVQLTPSTPVRPGDRIRIRERLF